MLFLDITHQLRLLERLCDAAVLALTLVCICVLLTVYALLQTLHLIECFHCQ